MKNLLRSSFALCLAATLFTGCKSNGTGAPSAPVSTPEAAVSAFHVDPATAASIHGTVTYTGWKPTVYKLKYVDMSSDPQCVKANKERVVDMSISHNSKGGLANAFVYVSKGLEGKHFAVPSTPVTIDQGGCWFRPRVVGIQVGQTLDVTNSDPVTHNIHPMATVNREWNHSQGPGDPPMHRKFTKVEVAIPVKCNIHGWMHDSIGVVDSPYFAVTKEDGSFDLPNLPPGTYTVTAWHEKLGTQQTTVTLAARGGGEANLVFAAK